MKRKFIPVSEPNIGKEEIENVKKCVESTWISSLGEYIIKFEEEFKNFIGTKYSTTTSNGTTAIHLALITLGIGPGDEVIVPDLTFVATANAVYYTGAKPVLVDIDKDTWNIDINKIEKAITKRTKAIIPVHLYGNPANMIEIKKIAKKHNLFIIEDCAEAIGAEINGKKVGSFSDISAFSFYGNKVITTGEGGMVCTNNKKYIDRAILYKDHGMSKTRRYYHPVVGFNYRMTNMQASIGVAQLKKINKFIKRKLQIANRYKKNLASLDFIKYQESFIGMTNIHWMFSLLVPKRNKLMKFLKENNIDSRPFFVPMSELPAYKTNKKFPVSEKLAKMGMNLPSSTTLTNDDVDYISKKIIEFYK